MKAKILLLKICFAILILGSLSTQSHAQEGNDDFVLIAKPTNVYWHFINIIFREDRRARVTRYILRPSGSAYHEGDERGFTKALWRESRSQRLAIGPFWDQDRIVLAKDMYRSLSGRSLSAHYDLGEKAYWYYIKVELRRSGYRWITLDSDISEGTVEQFYNALPLGLEQGMLAVGHLNIDLKLKIPEGYLVSKCQYIRFLIA